jgi:hypothetical protein
LADVVVSADSTAAATRTVALDARDDGTIVLRCPFAFRVRLDPPTVTPDDAADWDAAARVVVGAGPGGHYAVTLGVFA